MSYKIPQGINMQWANDIFVDVQIANRFATPPNEHYENLIKNLLTTDKNNPANNLVLVLSETLINKYFAGNRLSQRITSIGVIINNLIANKRYNSVGKEICKSFKKKHIDNVGKRVNLHGVNIEDKFLFPLVFYSNKKRAIIEDNSFRNAVMKFPTFSKGVTAVSCPSECKL